MMDAQIEFYTWADRIAGEMQKRKVKKQVVHGMWTPSGYFHIGNARTELLIPGLVFQALEDAGTHAKFNFFVDDADDLDAVPAGLNLNAEDFKEHLEGLPNSEKLREEIGEEGKLTLLIEKLILASEQMLVSKTNPAQIEAYIGRAIQIAQRLIQMEQAEEKEL